MKHLRIIILILVTLMLLLGCAPQAEQTEDAYTPLQTATGGVAEPADNINVKDIDITSDGADTVLTILMLSGSRAAGYTESKLVSLPEYEITQLKQPQRLMIRLHDISFWDYETKDDWALSDFVLGMFREVPADDDSLILYIQLSRSAEFAVDEVDGDLVIRLTPGAAGDTDMYYCVANAFFEHQEGIWPQSIDMLPVLCSDGTNKMLISQPFESKPQAQAFAQTANNTLQAALKEASVYVIALSAGALPDYTSGVDISLSDDKSVVMKDGVLMDTPLLLQNGKYLATAADGRIAFSRSYKPEEPALEQDIYLLSEKLWLLDPNGRIQNIDVSEFFSISDAAFSMDGRYLAILDVSIENRVLYIYDFETEKPFNLGEEGFGNQTASFAWSDTGNTLYAMTGRQGAMQLMSCTFMPDGTHDFPIAVEEQAGAEGALAESNGRLLFADNFAGDTGVIYEIGDTRREITTGSDLRVSPDGKTLLVLEAIAMEGEERLTSLKLVDIETGEATVIVSSVEVSAFCFMQDGGKVYFIDAAVAEPRGEYIYALFSYDIISGSLEQVALTSTDDFAQGSQPGEIYLIDYIDDAEQGFYATFVYDSSL